MMSLDNNSNYVKRARILRDTSNGDGLISIDGQQTAFTLEKHWRSDTAPETRMVVDAEFNSNHELISIHAVSESELAKEEMARLSEEANKKAKAIFTYGVEIGSTTFSQIIQRVGVVTLIGIISLVISWFYLSCFEFSLPFVGKISFRFYDLLLIFNNDYNLAIRETNAGIWGLACYAALAAPLLPHFVKKRWAWLGYSAPLALLIAVPSIVFMKLMPVMKEFSAAQANSPASFADELMTGVVKQAAKEVMKEPTYFIGMGLYISVIVALFLAGKGFFKFLASR